ncbi:FbpB family small basic protein [Cytobacillus oceanisediminis]|uniref:FbpB family small basic protein n=1 Tax=Niallia circulans TaxID=1397 RepID=A0A941JPT8_NIACI|nr:MULTISPECIES: FbpB family small basic protein [Niallia]MBQ6445944.1 FbpB family small basic protein [Bacillus sp. (in: firmicutes)]MBZ9534603.1 FbpB family small basic protein [Cytobacillus oceanisediminis]MCB5236111.1 FbpB family small basic protein [Niallia circulans]MED3790929.1 FbpB family small basic protein [Niallia alba]
MNKKTLKQLVNENKNLILKDKRIIDNIYKKIEDRIMQNKK